MRNARAFFELVVSLRETFSSGLDEASKNVVPLYLLVEEKGTVPPFLSHTQKDAPWTRIK